MTGRSHHSSNLRASSSGFTLLEVLIGLSILTVGVVAIIAIYPTTMKGAETAELRTLGASLAMMKVEEIRRDNDENDKLINGIKALSVPTEAVPFGTEPRLAYRLSGTTIIYQHTDSIGFPINDPGDPRDDPGVARVIIQLNPLRYPGKMVVLDEFRFDK